MSYVPIFTEKAELVDALVQYMSGQEKYYITLDAKTVGTDFVTLNSQLRQWSLRINDYCYGRKYRRREKRLKIAGAIERGEFTQRLHTHLILGHDDDCEHELWKMDLHCRRSWYKVTKSTGSIFGNLVDVRPVENCRTRADYSNKRTKFYHYVGEEHSVYL